MRAPSARFRHIATAITVPLAVLAAALLVAQVSSTAFTAQTRNIGNSWETGSLLLSDDDLGVAGVSITNATPGESGVKCIAVTSSSSSPGVVKVYLARLGAQGLQDNILFTLEIGEGGSFGSCAGFVPDGAIEPAMSLAQSVALNYDYASGALPWATDGVASGESKTYRLSWTFDTTGMSQTEIDALQGTSVSADVVWELQTN